MKAQSALILLAGLHLLSPLATAAPTASGAEPPAPPPSSDGQTIPDPGPAENPGEMPLPKEGLVRMEVFTLSLEDGRAATRKFPQAADLYAWLGAELEKEKPAVKLERLLVLRVRAGQKSRLEEIDEYSYPATFGLPKIPQSIGIGQPAPAPTPTPPPAKPDPDSSNKPSSHYLPATPQAFETRNPGWTAEIELTISDDDETVDLNIAPEFVRLCGLERQSPTGEIVQPVFETSKIATQILTKFGQPTLAGTFSPPVNAGAEGGNTEKVTRLLFLTVTNPR